MLTKAPSFSLSPLESYSPAKRYFLALLPTFIILSCVPFYPDKIVQTPAILLYPPVLLAAWLGGYLTGVVSLLICSAFSLFVFKAHVLTDPASDIPSLIRLFIYLSTNMFFLLLMDKLEKAVKRARTALSVRDDFISVASHELKTPLTSLKIQLDVARLKFTDDETPELKELLKKLTKQTTRLDHLITAMVDISLIDSEQFFLFRKHCELSQIAGDVVEYMKEKHPSISFQVHSEAHGNWDYSRIEHIAYSLILNAIRYGKASPIMVEVLNENDQAVLIVKDQGDGLSEKEMSDLFKRYPQINPNYQDAGMGLGLYLSQRIVSLHDGTISVKSLQGQGTTFKVTLPQTQPG